MKRFLLSLAVLGLSSFATAVTATPIISEFLADNDNGLKDEDGEDQDWIEIYNPDAVGIDLAGWTLTDDVTKPAKWAFPSRTLDPGARLLVFASEKNRRPASGNLHTNFKLDQDGEYLALIAPGGTVATEFAPKFPFQTANTSFGIGIAGTLSTYDLTPTQLTPDSNYARVQITGAGTAVYDGSLNSFDDSLTPAKHQQYLWYNYGSLLANIPAGQTVVQATLEWSGRGRVFAGVSGLSCVAGSVGVHQAPDANRGVTSIATVGNGDDIVNWSATHTPVSSLNYTLDRDTAFSWDVTPMVAQWVASPAMAQRGQFILTTSTQPTWVAWDQNRRGPKLTVRTTASATPATAKGFMSPTPGAANTGVTPAGPFVSEVTENPPAPAAGAGVVITARIAPGQGGALFTNTLTYRKAYDAEASVAMVDNGTNGDAAAGDGIFSATIPSASVIAGQMLRWKVTAVDASGYSTKMPPYRNTLDSPEYFGTVPVDPAITTNLMLVHWFVANPAAAATAGGTRCSVYLNGEFYDNLGINLHGQSTSGAAFLKKSYDIDGNRGYRFKWSTDPAQPRAKDINLLTIYADKTKVRQDLAYEMNREAGVAAHYCFLVRVQQNGTFNGIYDFVEDGDDVFLERSGLNKDGALYKMYNNMLTPANDAVVGAEKKNRKTENNADLQAFVNGMNLTDNTQRKNFLMDNVDIPKMINFMAGNSVTANVDLHAKNYYIYRDSGKSDLWTLLPWDLDLSQGRLWTSTNNYFDDGIYVNPNTMGLLTGTGQGLVAKMYGFTDLKEMAKRRIRTLHEMFWKQSATAPDTTRWYDRRVQEIQTLVGADAALDHAKYAPAAWKNEAGITNGSAASTQASNTMAQEISRVFTNYVAQRVSFAYSHADMPAAVTWASLSPLTFGTVEHTPASGNQDEEYIEIRNPNLVSIDLSGWKLTDGVDFTFEPGTVIPGRVAPAAYYSLYVCAKRNAFKLRTTGPRGGQGLYIVGNYSGHLSSLGETVNLLDADGVTVRATTNYTGSPSPYQTGLVISEIMYAPAGDGLAEYLELMNIGPVPLAMSGVRFTNGIEFDFTGSPVSTLAPGARTVIVRDLAAFQAVHGTGVSVAGVFANATALNNGGETLKLEDPDDNTIKEFAYDNVAPWPTAPANGSASLVLIRPETNPDPSIPSNWRASAVAVGTPGGTDALPFAGSPTADSDGDGLNALLEYGLGTSDADGTNAGASIAVAPAGSVGSGGFDITFPRQLAADAIWHVEISTATAAGWAEASWAVTDETPMEPGRVQTTVHITVPDSNAVRYFVRLRLVRP